MKEIYNACGKMPLKTVNMNFKITKKNLNFGKI